jgi:hypothetical protein
MLEVNLEGLKLGRRFGHLTETGKMGLSVASCLPHPQGGVTLRPILTLLNPFPAIILSTKALAGSGKGEGMGPTSPVRAWKTDILIKFTSSKPLL